MDVEGNPTGAAQIRPAEPPRSASSRLSRRGLLGLLVGAAGLGVGSACLPTQREPVPRSTPGGAVPTSAAEGLRVNPAPTVLAVASPSPSVEAVASPGPLEEAAGEPP